MWLLWGTPLHGEVPGEPWKGRWEVVKSWLKGLLKEVLQEVLVDVLEALRKEIEKLKESKPA